MQSIACKLDMTEVILILISIYDVWTGKGKTYARDRERAPAAVGGGGITKRHHNQRRHRRQQQQHHHHQHHQQQFQQRFFPSSPTAAPVLSVRPG